MRIWKVIVVLVILAAVGFALARHLVVRNVVQTLLAENVGAEVEIGHVDVDIWRSTVSMTGIHFRNPEGFPGDTALEINQIDVSYRFLSLFTRTVRLPEVVLDVARVVLVTNEEGETNFQHMLVNGGKRQRAGNAPETMAEDGEAAEALDGEKRQASSERDTHIDRLIFRLGEVETRDHSRSRSEPAVRNYRLNLERTFTDVRKFDAVAQAVGTDLAMTAGPQLLQDVMEESDVTTEDIMETISTHEGDMDELGRKLDEQTKDLQRELRRQFRSLRE